MLLRIGLSPHADLVVCDTSVTGAVKDVAASGFSAFSQCWCWLGGCCSGVSRDMVPNEQACYYSRASRRHSMSWLVSASPSSARWHTLSRRAWLRKQLDLRLLRLLETAPARPCPRCSGLQCSQLQVTAWHGVQRAAHQQLVSGGRVRAPRASRGASYEQ